MMAIVLALGVSACAGDNDPAAEPPTTAPPEAADQRPTSPEAASFPPDFVKQVDPICDKAQAEIDKLVGTEIRDPARLKELIGVFEDTATELEGLKPPTKNAEAYQEFTDGWRDGVRNFTQLEGEVGRGDNSAYQRVTSTLDEVDVDIKENASQFGFQDCATD